MVLRPLVAPFPLLMQELFVLPSRLFVKLIRKDSLFSYLQAAKREIDALIVSMEATRHEVEAIQRDQEDLDALKDKVEDFLDGDSDGK